MMPVPSLPENQPDINIRPDRISKNSLWIFLGLLSSAAISLVTILFLTRYLGPEKFGLYSVALSLTSLFIPLSNLGLDLHLTRTVSANPKSLTRELAHTLSAKTILSAIVWILIILTASLLKYSTVLIGYVALFGISMLVGSMAQSFIASIRAIRKMRYESISIFTGKMAILFGVLFMIIIKANITMIILANLLGMIVLFMTSLYFLKLQIGHLDIYFSLKGIKSRLESAFPFGLASIFVVIYYRIDTVMLSKMVDINEVGIYNSAYNIVLASMILSSPIAVSLFPALSAIYSKNKNEADHIFNKGVSFSVLLGLPLGIGTALMAKPIIEIAYGVNFVSSVPLLLIMSGTIPLLFVTHIFGSSIGAVGFQKRVAWVTAINGSFNVLLNLILIPHYGTRGAAIATLLTEFLSMIQLIIASKGIFEKHVLKDLLKICLCCILGTAGFILTIEYTGPWLAAGIFALVYAGFVFALKLVPIDMVKNILASSRE